MTQEKGPPVPLPGFVGWRFDPPWAWLFAKGVYDPHKLFKYTYGPGHA
jgi:hypothetical protein